VCDQDFEHLAIRERRSMPSSAGRALQGGVAASERGSCFCFFELSTGMAGLPRIELTASIVLDGDGLTPLAPLASLFLTREVDAMSIHPVLPESRGFEPDRLPAYNRKNLSAPLPFRFPARTAELDAPNRHAELFYLQKQIQAQTPMVIVLEDGERIDGCIEWYDRNSIKVRGRSKVLLYKSAIKYMYKLGDNG
jgi:sRNA-binding regulator protein Hfq